MFHHVSRCLKYCKKAPFMVCFQGTQNQGTLGVTGSEDHRPSIGEFLLGER
jgi:hypothetical protein